MPTPAVPGVRLGRRVGPFAGCVDEDLVRRFAAATNDPSPQARSGVAMPPVALVTSVWDAQNAAREVLVAEEVQRSATGGVHGEHDVRRHREIVPGERLRTWVEAYGSRPAGRNAVVTLRYVTIDVAYAVVAEQWWSTVYLGTTCEQVGEAPPDHAFPEQAREHLVGTYGVEVDPDMARRYAEVSGDWSPHHFEVDAARASGAERPFLHGVCTMALCSQGVAQLVADGDPRFLQRVAVRFAAPMPLGESLRLRVYDAGHLTYAFEAECAGVPVVTHGRAELIGAAGG
jgi:acyl dehydratase